MSKRGPSLTEAEQARILFDLSAGLSVREIARNLGRSRQAVANVQRRGVVKPPAKGHVCATCGRKVNSHYGEAD